MILNRQFCTLVFALILSSNMAFASMVCSSNIIVKNEISYTCVSMKIPDNGSINSTQKCNGYKISITCDLHSNPNSIELSITGPQGNMISTDSSTELDMVDDDGNGVFVSCE